MPSNTVEFLGQYLDLVIKYKFNNSYNNGSNSRKLEDKSNLQKDVKDCNENKIGYYKTHVKKLNNCSYCDTEDNFKTKKYLEEHIKLFHSLQCNFCKLGDIKTKEDLEKHINELHKIESKYHVDKKIGFGSFGEIHEGRIMESDEKVAFKLEIRKTTISLLQNEYQIYKYLNNHKGIPKVYDFESFSNKKYNAMVMELLGPSLLDLHEKNGDKLSQRIVLQIAIQIIDILKFIHSKGLIHCDIKPENILMGRSSTDKENVVHLIDFGLSKKYFNSNTGKHISYRENMGTGTGTARYMSINTHLGHEQSRRDDMESLGFMIVFLMKGRLPWQGLKCKTKQEHMKKICDTKRTYSIKRLCDNCPIEFKRIMLPYFLHVRNLSFEEAPKYDYLKKLFSDICKLKGYQNDDLKNKK